METYFYDLTMQIKLEVTAIEVGKAKTIELGICRRLFTTLKWGAQDIRQLQDANDCNLM